MSGVDQTQVRKRMFEMSDGMLYIRKEEGAASASGALVGGAILTAGGLIWGRSYSIPMIMFFIAVIIVWVLSGVDVSALRSYTLASSLGNGTSSSHALMQVGSMWSKSWLAWTRWVRGKPLIGRGVWMGKVLGHILAELLLVRHLFSAAITR
jgi:hypothetical protein